MAINYTIYDLSTEAIVHGVSHIPRAGLPDGLDWIAGEVDQVRFRINRETGKPYPFIEQDQLPWLIRNHGRGLLRTAGATDADVAAWAAAKATHDMLGGASVAGQEYSDQAFKTLLETRRRILDAAARLMAMEPMPQDFDNPAYWE